MRPVTHHPFDSASPPTSCGPVISLASLRVGQGARYHLTSDILHLTSDLGPGSSLLTPLHVAGTSKGGAATYELFGSLVDTVEKLIDSDEGLRREVTLQRARICAVLSRHDAAQELLARVHECRRRQPCPALGPVVVVVGPRPSRPLLCVCVISQ